MATREETCRAFARNLQNAMNGKGWSQSDLARRAFGTTGSGGAKKRDNISNYINARTLPTARHLAALCKALGIERDKLMPADIYSADRLSPAPLKIEMLSNGNAMIQVHQEVSGEVAMKIMELLRG